MNESAERQLRQGLHALVVDPPLAPPAAAAAVRAGRGLRRRRRVAVTLAGVAVLAIVAIPVLHRPASPAQVGDRPATAASGPPTTDPSRFPVVQESSSDGVQRGPDQATIGTPYAFDLYIHCGIRNANFSGAWWKADPVQPTYSPDAPNWSAQMYLLGTMTLVSSDEARFDAPAEGLHVTFRPLTGQLELCQ